jgi:streptogramin lyase
MLRLALPAMMVALLPVRPVPAQRPITTWRATEQWRVDGSEGEAPFGDLRDFVALRDGTVWVLDFKDQVIRRYAADGRALPTIARKGSGPGELRNANGMLVTPAGEVVVSDPQNARLAVFAADGKFARHIALPISGWRYRWEAWLERAQNELVEMDFATQVAAFRRVALDGTVRGTIPVVTCPADDWKQPPAFRAETKGRGGTVSAYPFTTGGGLAGNGRGGVWCASTHSTRVALIRLGGTDTIARTSVEVQLVPVAPAERAERLAALEKRIATYANNDFDRSKVPNVKPGISALYVDDDGRLWVRHADRYKTAQTVFDVHDAKGVHLARMTLPVRSNGYLPVRARGDALWLTVLDDDDVTWLARYQIRRN